MDNILNAAESAVKSAFSTIDYYQKEVDKYTKYLEEQKLTAKTLQDEYDQLLKKVGK